MSGSQINKLILQTLQTGDKYGLEIIKDIEESTHGTVVVKQPSLYSALSRMEKKGLISSFWRDSEIGGRRHYYSLTNLGQEEIKEKKKPVDMQEFANPNRFAKEQQDEVQPIVETKIVEPKIEPMPIAEPLKIIKQEPEKPQEVFEQFDPSKSQDIDKPSFTQQMREYVEPESIEEVKPEPVSTTSPTPFFEKTEPEPQPKVEPIHTNFNNYDDADVEIIREEHKSNRNEINYKDILGDLDADLQSNEVIPSSYESIKSEFVQPREQIEEKPTAPRKQSEYSKQIAEILRSEKKVETKERQASDLYAQQSKDLLEEINRRYNLDKRPTPTNNDHKIAPTSVGYTHIKQENIVIKPYSKTEKVAFSKKTFIDKNKFNLCRAGIMTVIFMIELIISYFLLRDAEMIYKPHEFLYILYGVLGFTYFGVMALLTFKDLDKKTRIKDINWGMNLLYRVLLAAVLATFVIAMCLCFGMTAPLEIEFFTLWYIPALAIADLLLSWIVGIIMYSTKIFRI